MVWVAIPLRREGVGVKMEPRRPGVKAPETSRLSLYKPLEQPKIALILKLISVHSLSLFFRQEEEMKVRKYQQDLRQRGLEKVTAVNVIYEEQDL